MEVGVDVLVLTEVFVAVGVLVAVGVRLAVSEGDNVGVAVVETV